MILYMLLIKLIGLKVFEFFGPQFFGIKAMKVALKLLSKVLWLWKFWTPAQLLCWLFPSDWWRMPWWMPETHSGFCLLLQRLPKNFLVWVLAAFISFVVHLLFLHAYSNPSYVFQCINVSVLLFLALMKFVILKAISSQPELNDHSGNANVAPRFVKISGVKEFWGMIMKFPSFDRLSFGFWYFS